MEHGDPMPPCSGRLIKAHLIPRQLLKREGHARWIDHAATWVWACGGICGSTGHHGMMDASRTLKIPYENLPPGTIALAEVLGLSYWLHREYPALMELLSV